LSLADDGYAILDLRLYMPPSSAFLLAVAHGKHQLREVLPADIRELHLVKAAGKAVQPSSHLEILLIFVQLIENDLSIIGPRAEKVRISDIGCREDPRIPSVKIF